MFLQLANCIYSHTVYLVIPHKRFAHSKLKLQYPHLLNKYLYHLSTNEKAIPIHIYIIYTCSYSLRPHIIFPKGTKTLLIILALLIICCSNSPISVTSSFSNHCSLYLFSLSTCIYYHPCIHVNIMQAYTCPRHHAHYLITRHV